jgi:hypothetical protein
MTSTRMSSHAKRRRRARIMGSQYLRVDSKVEFRRYRHLRKSSGTAGHSFAARNRNAFAMTDTELRDIAKAATTGLSRIPKIG